MVAAMVVVVAGCGPQRSGEVGTPVPHGHGGKGDVIGGFEQPEDLVANASRYLNDNITAADVGQTYGTDDNHIPYPDTYWPFTQDGIDAKWNYSDSSAPSALEKYMGLADASHVADAKGWEHNNHGAGVPGVSGWWGHCPGWTGAAMDNAPVQHAAYAMADGNGGFTSCNAGDAGCVKFEIGDINALMAEVYVDGDSAFIGARCDTKPSDVQKDANGRITQEGCDGVNAGSLVIVASTLMKQNQKPFAINAQNPGNTDQIWNQPAYRYSVNRFETLTMAQAANLVAHGTRDGDQTTYPWDTQAVGFAFVDFTISWVSENGPNTSVVSGADSTNQMHMVAVLELDQDPSVAGSNPTILGGEYIDDATAGANRLTVPPFAWVIHGPGPESLDTSVGGNNHNPYVKPSLVKQLIALGQQ
jgi:hypothetical protein